MSLYTKALKHIDMNRVKELYEEKITKQIALQEQQYLSHFIQNTVPKYYDWRTDTFNTDSFEEINKTVLKRIEEIDNALSEGMTSKGFEHLYGGIVTYDMVSISPNLVSSTFAQDLINASSEVTSHMFGPDFPGSYINSIGDYEVDSYTKVNVNAYYDSTFGSASGSGSRFTLNTIDGPGAASISSLQSALGITLPSGIPNDGLTGTPTEGSAVQRTFTKAIPGNVINFTWGFTSSERDLAKELKVDDYAFVAISGRTTKFVSILANGDVKGGSFKYRLQPSDIDANGNVKVSIGVVDVHDKIYNTTLRVSNFGSLYAGDVGSVGDTTDAADLGMPVNTPKKKKGDEIAMAGGTDAMSDDLYNWVNKTYGLPAAEWKKENPTKPNNSNPFLPKGSYVPKASGGKDYGNVAVKVRPVQGPSTEVYYDKKMKQFVPRNSGGVALDMVRKAHYEPEGEVLSEKKTFKDLTKKIPGYYDGKPSPLGFPEEEPPKMVNGFHPDLVDGKKMVNRFNRLDPISARAMPPTGNPYIDKKVRAAAKKPK